MNGVAAAVVSSMLGGTAGAITRYIIGATDPLTVAAFRFGIGFLLILPLALALRVHWPARGDWPGVAVLGTLFFSVFFFVYNLAMSLTTAARGSLALSSLPLATMLMAALLGRERLSIRKSTGVLIAMTGVAIALGTGLATAPPGAWRGDLVMMGGTLIMAAYTIASRPFMQRSSLLGFLAAGMGCGALLSTSLSLWNGGLSAAVRTFAPSQWWAVAVLGAFGGAAAFYLWVYALQRTTPTRVTNTMTANPLTASLVAYVLIGEPLGIELFFGMAAVAFGIWLASSSASAAAAVDQASSASMNR